MINDIAKQESINMNYNRPFISSESSSQGFDGQAKDFATQKIVAPHFSSIEKVARGEIPGFFIWWDSPMHDRHFAAIRSSLTGAERTILGQTFPESKGFKRLAFIAAYDKDREGNKYVYGAYIMPSQKPPTNYDPIKTLCHFHPSAKAVRDFKLNNRRAINNLVDEEQAFEARRMTSKKAAEKEKKQAAYDDMMIAKYSPSPVKEPPFIGFPPPSPPSAKTTLNAGGPDPIERLNNLANARSSGLISEIEFVERKKILLDSFF